MSRLSVVSRRALLIGLLLFAAFGLASWSVWHADSSSRAQHQHAQEVAAQAALAQTVGAAIAHEQELAQVIGVLRTPIGGRWALFSRTLLGDPANSGVGAVRSNAAGGRWLLEAYAPRPGWSGLRVGLDLAANPVEHAALQASTFTAEPQSTPPLLIPGRGHRESGVIIFDAVDSRGLFRGWVMAAYPSSLLSAAVAARVPGARLEVQDGSSVLVAGRGTQNALATPLAVAGQRWNVRIWVPEGAATAAPWFILLLGALLSLLVMFVLRGLGRVARVRSEGLAEAQRLAAVGSWSWDPREDRGIWSAEMFRIFGRDRRLGPALRDELLAYALLEDQPRLGAWHAALLAGEDSAEVECRIRGDDGAERAVHVTASKDPHHAGRYVGTVQDVSRLRAVEYQLRLSEHQVAEAHALAHLGSWEMDIIDERMWWSDELCRIFGQPVGFAPSISELMGLVHPDDRAALAARIDAARRSEFSNSDYRIVRPDGEVRHVHTRRFGRTDEHGVVVKLWGTTQDVTDRITAESEIRLARDHAEAIVTAMGEGYALTVDGTIAAVNDSLCELTGFTRDQLIGAGVPFPFWPTEQLSESREIRDRVVGAGGGTFEITLMRANGSTFDAEITAHPASDLDGSLLGFVNTIRDVSERKRYEAALERERRDLNDAQAVAGVGSWDYDAYADPKARWSEQLWRMLGLTPQASSPSMDEFYAMIVESDRERVRTAITEAVDAWDGEFGIFTADGRELIVSLHAECSRDEHGNLIGSHGTIQDITERAQRDAEERALGRISELVATNAGSAAVFEAVASEVQRLFGAHSGLVTRFDEAAGIGTVISGQRADGEPIGPLTFERDGETASAMVVRTGRSARIDAPPPVTGDPATKWLVRQRIEAGVAAPVMVGGKLWGTLAAGFSLTAIPRDAEERLARFARLMALAISNADSWDILSRQASTDAVTGVANHRTFQDRLRSEVARSRRYQRQLAVVLLDLDHFKAVNDTYGHQAGDKVLAEFGRRLTNQAREGELVARVGGEEFAWLMPESDGAGAYLAAERLRRAVESEPFAGVGKVTVSVGVCSSEPGLDGEQLVRLADRALYWAKDGGRNATFLYSDDAHALLTAKNRDVEAFQTMSSVRALARAIDSKDADTRQHSERVGVIAELLAVELGWTAKRARLLHDCGLLHDVGKIGIPDEILLKPSSLTATEYEQIKQHAELSARIASEVLEAEQVDWIRGHHERWDGSGYPDQLVGDQIPDGAQILAVADAYDVMIQTRTYKPRRSIAEALTEFRVESGKQFSPVVVDALLAVAAADAAAQSEAIPS